jgi:hypothetical protein
MGYWKARLLRLWMDEGGFLNLIPGIASAIGSLFGGGAKASGEARERQAALQLGQDRARTDQYGIGQQAQMALANTDLARKSFEEDSRGNRAKQALLGALLGNLQDVNISTPGIKQTTITGGLRPSALGEGGRAAGNLLNQQALMKMLQGDTFQGGQILQAPGVQATPKAGGFEKFAGTLGSIGSIVGGIGAAAPQLFGGNKPAQVPGIPMAQGGVPEGIGQSASLGGMPEAPPPSMQEILATIQALTQGGR